MEFCHSFGKDSSLVVIETEQENNHLKQWLIKNGWINSSHCLIYSRMFIQVILTQGCGLGALTMGIMASGPGLPLGN